MAVIVRLTGSEWTAASTIGVKRHQLRVERGRSCPEFADGGGTHEERGVVGSVSEYALAKHYGKTVLQDWCEYKSFSLEHHLIPCDVGKNLHVRGTKYRKGRLVTHPYDPATGLFVLGIVDDIRLRVTFVGWALCADTKKPCFWNDYDNGFRDRPAYTYDQMLLRPMEEIPDAAIWSNDP